MGLRNYLGGMLVLLALGLAMGIAVAVTDASRHRPQRRTVDARFVSLGADRVNLRYGPGREYPISLLLARKGLPVEIVAEFDTWRNFRL